MADSPPLGGSGLSDDEDVLDPLIRALGDLDDIDLEIDTKMFDGEGSASSFNFAEAAQDHVAASVAVGTTMAAAASQRAPAPAPAVAAAPVPAAAPPPPQPRPQPVPAAAPPPQQPPQQPAVDPMAAERAALYPPPDQPPRKLDWGEENGGAAPKRKSGSQYDIAPVIRRRHSKEEWSSEIDAGDGTRPKRRNSGDARDADWHLKNNMFGDDGGGHGYGQGGGGPGGGGYGGPPQDQQYGQYHEFQQRGQQQWQQGQYGQNSYQQQQQHQLPKRRHSGDARSAKWAMKNNMFGDRGGPGFGNRGGGPGYHSHADRHIGEPYGAFGGFDTPDREFRPTMERRRCNSDSKKKQWDDLLHESDDDDFGPEFDHEIARRRSLHGQRHDAGPGLYQPRGRSHSDGATTGITPEWAFGHDGDDSRGHHSGGQGGFGAPQMQAPEPEPFPSAQPHRNQYGHIGAPPSQFNHGAPPMQFNANMYSDRPPGNRKSKPAGGKMPRRYSDSRLKRWDVDDMFNSSDDDSAVGSEPIQPDDIFGPGRGGGGHGGGSRIARRGSWHKRKPISSAVSDSALDAFSDDDDSFGEPTPLQRVAAEHFHQYGNDGRDHAQLFTSGIPAYKDDQKIEAPTGMDQSQNGQNDSEDATQRKIAEMKEQIALLQSSMAALESTVQPNQAPQTEQAPQKPPEPTQDNIEPEPVTAAQAMAAPAGTGMSTFEAFEAAVSEDNDDDDDDDDDFGEQNTEEGSVDPITKLNQLMAKSQQSLKQLQEYDKSQGLPASHSQTMVKSSRSRRQLLEGKIMKKWDGTPMIEFDEQGRVIQQEKKRRSKKDDGKKKEGQQKEAADVVSETEEGNTVVQEQSGNDQSK